MFPINPQTGRDVTDLPVGSRSAVSVAADKTLKVYEQLVRASVNTASGNITVTLPSPSESQGLAYFVSATIANAKTVTVTDPESTISDIVLDTNGDDCIVVSNGQKYFVLKNPAVTVLTDSSGGTASDTIAAIGATYDQAEVRNAIASLAAKVNALLNATFNNA